MSDSNTLWSSLAAPNTHIAWIGMRAIRKVLHMSSVEMVERLGLGVDAEFLVAMEEGRVPVEPKTAHRISERMKVSAEQLREGPVTELAVKLVRSRLRPKTHAWPEMLRELLKTQNLTHAQVGKRVGVSGSAVGHWLRGRGVSPVVAERLRVAFGIVVPNLHVRSAALETVPGPSGEEKPRRKAPNRPVSVVNKQGIIARWAAERDWSISRLAREVGMAPATLLRWNQSGRIPRGKWKSLKRKLAEFPVDTPIIPSTPITTPVESITTLGGLLTQLRNVPVGEFLELGCPGIALAQALQQLTKK